MNRVKIVDLPGLDLPPKVKGALAYHLLSAEALRQQILAQAKGLGLSETTPDLLRVFDGYITAVSPSTRHLAQAIATEYGRFLAYLLLTLKRGDAINQAARPDWQAEQWAFWGQINTVLVGGGLMSGNLGETAVSIAANLIHKSGFPNFTLYRAKHPVQLPLIGVGRLIPANAKAALLFDFGQTSVKRAVAHYENGILVKLQSLTSIPANCADIQLNKDTQLARQTLVHILDMVETGWQEAMAANVSLCDQIGISMACYLGNGHPLGEYTWGCYGRLQVLAPHLQTFLAEQISHRLNKSIEIRLLHDGTAAALPFAGEQKTAVLTFGTAIGVGFPPQVDDLRPMSF